MPCFCYAYFFPAVSMMGTNSVAAWAWLKKISLRFMVLILNF